MKAECIKLSNSASTVLLSMEARIISIFIHLMLYLNLILLLKLHPHQRGDVLCPKSQPQQPEIGLPGLHCFAAQHMLHIYVTHVVPYVGGEQ